MQKGIYCKHFKRRGKQMVNQQEYVSFVVKKFQELAEKFKAKNEWYKGRVDGTI